MIVTLPPIPRYEAPGIGIEPIQIRNINKSLLAHSKRNIEIAKIKGKMAAEIVRLSPRTQVAQHEKPNGEL